MKQTITAEEALSRLRAGNGRYLEEKKMGDFSRSLRSRLYGEGQSPYAVIVTCSDSRVVPEAIFDAGLGELFVIRVAGNVIGSHELASIDYAVSHLGCPLVVILGHTGCGAVAAALGGSEIGPVAVLIEEILQAASRSDPPDVACRKNVLRGVEKAACMLGKKALAVGAVCEIRDGSVCFL